MATKKKKSKIFETRNFSIFIGLFVFSILLIITYGTDLITNLELLFLDGYFNTKQQVTSEKLTEGATRVQRNPYTSDDIVIVKIDNRSLENLGKWPFPRSVIANLVNSFARINDQNNRERALFLDIFFFDRDSYRAEDDTILIDAINKNNRVFLEAVLGWNPIESTSKAKDFFESMDLLYDKYGNITNIQGNWEKMDPFFGVEPPLKPYASVAHGYGHANYIQDDDEVYRRQPLVARFSKIIAENAIPIEKLKEEIVKIKINRDNYEWLSWLDKEDKFHLIKYPITENDLAVLEKEMAVEAVRKKESEESAQEYYIIRTFKDNFVPAITLSLAMEYFNKKPGDIEVKIGEYIRIPQPEFYNTETNKWEKPYKVKVADEKFIVYLDENGDEVKEVIQEAQYKNIDEIRIPIDENGKMLVNFMGIGSTETVHTFGSRSFYTYTVNVPGPDPETSAVKWRDSRGLKNKVLMVGAFSQGMAADEKPTPFGMMFGVEIHANALNTIIKDNFLYYAPWWINMFILLGLVLITAFIVSRLPTILSLLVSGFMIYVFYMIVSNIFHTNYIINFTAPAVGMAACFLFVVAYRVMTEERDKRRIKNMFGKYVSPSVVEQMMERPPELGGVDKELTVFFSDIRGFTTLSETMTPQALVNHLNMYLTAMTNIIMDYFGTLDKYVGDEIMCFWGAPLPQADHAILGCKCALKQMQVLRQLNENWPPEKRINIGIGLNSGIMTVGNMGSQGRMNYTLMGDNVNLGARLEGTNKQYHTNIIISEYTYGLVKDRVIAREMDNIRVKGKNKPVLIYELIDIKGGLEPDIKTTE